MLSLLISPLLDGENVHGKGKGVDNKWGIPDTELLFWRVNGNIDADAQVCRGKQSSSRAKASNGLIYILVGKKLQNLSKTDFRVMNGSNWFIFNITPVYIQYNTVQFKWIKFQNKQITKNVFASLATIQFTVLCSNNKINLNFSWLNKKMKMSLACLTDAFVLDNLRCRAVAKVAACAAKRALRRRHHLRAYSNNSF